MQRQFAWQHSMFQKRDKKGVNRRFRYAPLGYSTRYRITPAYCHVSLVGTQISTTKAVQSNCWFLGECTAWISGGSSSRASLEMPTNITLRSEHQVFRILFVSGKIYDLTRDVWWKSDWCHTRRIHIVYAVWKQQYLGRVSHYLQMRHQWRISKNYSNTGMLMMVWRATKNWYVPG